MHRVEWPKNFTVSEKRAWTPDVVMSRTEKRYQDSLSHVVYIRDSILCRRDITGEFTMGIGLDLFAKVSMQGGGTKSRILWVRFLQTSTSSIMTEQVISRIYFSPSK